MYTTDGIYDNSMLESLMQWQWQKWQLLVLWEKFTA